MGCAKCGSNNLKVVTENTSDGFGAGKSCLGTILFGPFGFLCGLCGMGKSKSKTFRLCVDCGARFK